MEMQSKLGLLNKHSRAIRSESSRNSSMKKFMDGQSFKPDIKAEEKAAEKE